MAPCFELHHRWNLLPAMFLAIGISASARAANVWVITDGRHPIKTTPGVEVIELDAPSAIETGLSVQLPSEPRRAAAIARERLVDGGAMLRARLAAACQGVVDAWSLGITKIPAVVVDGRYVVYGVPDVNEAVSLIERYRRKRP
jgi:integrating conjugative element protein (TIGR03757 family)